MYNFKGWDMPPGPLGPPEPLPVNPNPPKPPTQGVFPEGFDESKVLNVPK